MKQARRSPGLDGCVYPQLRFVMVKRGNQRRTASMSEEARAPALVVATWNAIKTSMLWQSAMLSCTQVSTELVWPSTQKPTQKQKRTTTQSQGVVQPGHPRSWQPL